MIREPSHCTPRTWKASLCIWHPIILEGLDQYKVTKARSPDGAGFSQLKLASLGLAHLSFALDPREFMDNWTRAKAIPHSLRDVPPVFPVTV